MSCFTLTWQLRRQPSRICPLVKWPSSVGRMSPPPSSTWQRHCAQVPPPPQAEDRKIPWSARVPSSLPPAGASMPFSASSLISMCTLPVATRRERAARITATSASTMAVNMTTPRIISTLMIQLSPYSCTPENDMKPSDIRPTVMKVMPRPFRPSGTSLYLSFSRIPASNVIASAHPVPAPTPYTMDSPRV